MIFKSKKYKIKITKERFLNTVKDKLRLPAEDVFIGPFTSKKCEWVTGKIDNNSFELSDYRFSKVGIKINGKINEDNNDIEVLTNINFKTQIIIIQSFFMIWFISLVILSEDLFMRLFFVFTLLTGGIGNYFIFSSYIKGFYYFFENLFKNENLIVIEE